MSGCSCQDNDSGGAAAGKSKKQSVKFDLRLSESDRRKSTLDGFILVVVHTIPKYVRARCISSSRPAMRAQCNSNRSLFQARPVCVLHAYDPPQNATVIVSTIVKTIAIAGGAPHRAGRVDKPLPLPSLADRWRTGEGRPLGGSGRAAA